MSRHVLNLYEISNAAELKIAYRLIDVDGLTAPDLSGPDEAYRQLNMLAKLIAYKERQPVSVIRSQGTYQVAVPADAELSQVEYNLAPDVITLKPLDKTHNLALSSLTQSNEAIAMSFLSFCIKTPLNRNRELWRSGPSSFFLKQPRNRDDRNHKADVFIGFSFRLVIKDAKVFLGMRLSHKYASASWLSDEFKESDMPNLKMKHMLYHYGERWFPVQFLGVTGKSLIGQRFLPEEGGAPTNVYNWTIRENTQNPPNWITDLDRDSPAISFRYPGNEKKRYGAAALCKLLLSTEESHVHGLHRWAIMDPQQRFDLMADLVSRYLRASDCQGIPLKINRTPLRERPSFFPVPAQLFGTNKVLRVGSNPTNAEIPLSSLGKVRMELLSSSQGGFAVSTQVGHQYILVPKSLARPIVEGFKKDVDDAVAAFIGNQCQMELVIYDDSGCRSLKNQVDAITESLDRLGIKGAHGVLILPERAQPDLHNFIKRKQHNRIQVQCVRASELRGFYHTGQADGKMHLSVPPTLRSRYRSYIRYAAMGLLLVNRQWPWVLEQMTHYDAYVAVDVLNNTAAFTFFYSGGRHCFVRGEVSRQKEKLLRQQMKTTVASFLKMDLQSLDKQPNSVVLRRDGRVYDSEWLGFIDAINELKEEGLLSTNTKVGAVEVHKSSSIGLRIVEESEGGQVRNPRIGAWSKLDETTGAICTTGYPFRFSGTVNPLVVSIAHGDLDLDRVLEDTFRMSQLCWPVPDRCMRLPVDLKLCDDYLRSAAAEADDDSAIFGDDPTTDEAEFEIYSTNRLR